MATDLSRKLRRQATPAELNFWKLTQTWRQQGWHFRRQFQLGSYYVDFVCIAAGLVVEIDGDTNGTDLAISNDAVRDDYLRGRGFTVLRFSNQDVLTNAEGVFSRVAAHLEIRAPVPQPRPPREGEGAAPVCLTRPCRKLDRAPSPSRGGLGWGESQTRFLRVRIKNDHTKTPHRQSR
ncbi:endonuclease domain-containing protein [Devosia sp. Root436]|uniref:endonuclease domain-containing protein n=1 Tax=Devosia sp. Root436 TaxID=1736537 RepID=UPI0009EC250D|nr:endonuclease domain-containing protein [Devosia sp. Root436]